MISPAEALGIVLDAVSPLAAESVDVFNAASRVLAEDVVAKRMLPPRDNSGMDGYAVRSEDVRDAPVRLTVVGTVAAGDDPAGVTVTPGTCARIMTGAFVPAGADAVVEYEVTEEDANGSVLIREPRKRGASIRSAGSDIRTGDVIPVKGVRMSPFVASRLIAAGVLNCAVHRRPKVAVISSGNELADPSSIDDPDKTPDSNAFLALEMLKILGCKPSYLGIAKDDLGSFKAVFRELSGFDAVVMSAGVSEGDFDVIQNDAESLGIKWLVKNVAQKPGKPLGFGTADGVPLFALPGNPVSAAFCLYFYGIPAFRRMSGRKDAVITPVTAVLDADVKAHPSRTRFDRASLVFDNGYRAIPYASQGSHVIGSLVETDAFIEIEPGGTAEAGSTVRAYRFGELYE